MRDICVGDGVPSEDQQQLEPHKLGTYTLQRQEAGIANLLRTSLAF